jgi:hypothetical protein
MGPKKYHQRLERIQVEYVHPECHFLFLADEQPTQENMPFS